MIRMKLLFAVLALTLMPVIGGGKSVAAQTSPVTSTSEAPASSVDKAHPHRRSARRRQRTNAVAGTPSTGKTPSVSSTVDQQRRDAQILAAQQAQSAETARENDAVTQKVIRDQKQQQAEPRIQDAPGPGAQPLPGDPAVQPTQPVDPPRIQDAPGPAQTLPKPPQS